MRNTSPAVVTDLAPSGVLRASINLGNPVLAQGTPAEPAGVTVDIVKRGSAYDLFLSRTLQRATVVPGAEGTHEFLTRDLEAAAGIREPITEFVATHPGFRIIEEPFMEIRQAVGTAKNKRGETTRFLHGLVEELKATGFIADSLRRPGQSAIVAPAA